jgi:hypothetical protein
MIGDSCTTRPFGSSQRLTIMSQYAIISLVATLFSSCCPSTVARFIVSIVVYPLQAVRRGRLSSHVGEEVIKGILPSFAYLDTTTTVVFITCTVWSVTSLIHGIPGVVLRGMAHGVSPASISTETVLQPKATATSGRSLTQASALNNRCAAACANASPAVILFSPRNLTANIGSDSQSTKGVSAKILKSGRQNDTLELIHGMSFREKGNLWSGLGSVLLHYLACIILANYVCY